MNECSTMGVVSMELIGSGNNGSYGTMHLVAAAGVGVVMGISAAHAVRRLSESWNNFEPGPPLVDGRELYKRAKKIIPGGTGLLSKRPEIFLPNQWPSYYSRAKGCNVWDVAGNMYIDFICTPGCFILGAADPDVNKAVSDAVQNGSFSTLNAPEEVELAELLVDLHPWAKKHNGMVRFARGGGEICMMAARIARAHTGRDRIAVCGYHGYTDFYLAANIKRKGSTSKSRDPLGKHWLAGVDPAGVPSQLEDTTCTFQYGDSQSLEHLLQAHPDSFAAIVMEVARSGPPPSGFLQTVRDLATEHGCVLIFDEVSAAWRQVCGGCHLLYGVDPDIATFSKAMSNGFAMAALVGRGSVMQSAQSTFISTTYHTERIGPVAALATIKKFQRCDVQRVCCERGRRIKQAWSKLAEVYGLEVAVSGIDCWPSFSFQGKKVDSDMALLLTSLFTQEMLARGILANATVAVSFAHNDAAIDAYLRAVAETFEKLSLWLIECEGDVNACRKYLKGPIRHAGFHPV